MKQINFDCSDDLRVCALSQSERRQRSGFTMCSFCGILLLALVCCAFRSFPDPAPVVITVANNGTVVNVLPDTPIIIRLSDISASTGYAWHFFPTKNSVVELDDTQSFSSAFSSSNPSRFGAAGLIEFTFEAEDPGNALLQFELRRPWEKSVFPAQRFGVFIHVIAPPVIAPPVTAPPVIAPPVIAPPVIAPPVTHHM
jgi:predicted secreted protein